MDILIERRIHKPMDVFHGSSFIVNRLYKIQGPQLTERHLARLEQFAQVNNLANEQERAQKEIQCFLTVLQNDHDRLKALWERHHKPMNSGFLDMAHKSQRYHNSFLTSWHSRRLSCNPDS